MKMSTIFASVLFFILSCPMLTFADEITMPPITDIDAGEKLVFHKKKGNCLACHAIKGGKLPGNIGPPLINMKQRYPTEAFLRAQIEDATENNPNSIMPPFIKHKILTEAELDKIIAFIYSL